VEEYLADGGKVRDEAWTGSIAVGSRPFVEEKPGETDKPKA